MNLQNFVLQVIEIIGGDIDRLEYALCYVILPDEYIDMFEGKSEMLLAFDIEVAQENPDSEFVTFGSYILDKIIEIANKKAICTTRYIAVDNLILGKAQEKLKNFLNIDRGILEILQEAVRE